MGSGEHTWSTHALGRGMTQVICLSFHWDSALGQGHTGTPTLVLRMQLLLCPGHGCV